MTTFLHELKFRNEVLYVFGWVCWLAVAICGVLICTTHTNVLGINAWYKPLKFFLSTAIFVWSMGWYTGYFGNTTAVVWYSWGMVVLFCFEDGYVAIQAARGQLSHFNVSTPVYAGLYSMMAIGAVGISLWTGLIGLSFFRNDFPDLPPAYLWSIRLGLLIFVLFSMQGLAMGARLTHTVGGDMTSAGMPITNWSRIYGDLRIAHFLGMHALQILPILAFYVVQNVRGIIAVALIYGLLTTAIFVQALQGKPFLK
ncbi:hypothetical protein J2I48_17845 [Fibrella sp. HMF5036]|uniref:Uncharacterized protein n=1 Tax=Fibrella aquatilis TaxID=2817059 RepID=A0A939G7Z5_9BACT|nr:hypothetical protein [Fibrella aquatilis]